MINVSNNYKQALTQPRTIDAKITYNSTTINIDDINSIKRSFNSTLFKTIAKQVIIDSNVSIDKDITINPQFGLYLDNQFEYVSLGSYKVKNSPNLNKDTNSYEITAYDKIVDSMVDYELTESDITYPCTVRQLFVAIFTKLGWSTSGIPATFVNSTSMIEEDVYSNVNFTYRDVLDELCTISCMFLIDVNGTPTLKQKTITSETINEDFMSDKNVQIKNQVFFNSLVFSRASNSDNIYRKDDTSIANNGLHEFKVSDLQILSLNWRDNFIDAMWNYIKTFTYYAYEVNTNGITYLEPIDTFTLSTFGSTYSTILLNSDLTIANGVNEKIYANEPIESETEYKYADTTDKRINQTNLIVDKQNGRIDAVVSQVEEIEQDLQNPTSTKEGQYFDIDNALDEPLIDFSLYGNTSQSGTPTPSTPQPIHNVSGDNTIEICGKNLFDKNNANIVYNARLYANGTYGSDAANGYYVSDYIRVKSNEDIAFSETMNYPKAVCLYDENKTHITRYQSSITTINTGNAYYIRFGGKTSSIDDMQVKYGTSSSEYEPYTGNSQLISLGVENIVDIDNIYSTSSALTKSWENGIATLTWTGSFSSYMEHNNSTYLPIQIFDSNKTYTISFKHKGNALYLRFDETSTNILGTNNDNDYTTYSYTFTGLSELVIKFIRKNSTGTAYLKDFQIEKGSKTNSYSEYGKPYIELCKIGNYKDYIYRQDNRWYLHKEIGRVVLNGTENNWQQWGSQTMTNTCLFGSPAIDNISNVAWVGLSNYFENSTTPIWQTDVEKIQINDSGTNKIRFRINKSIASTTSALKTWLSTHNTIVYYVLATPTDTEITDTTLLEQLNRLMTLPLYKKMTHITLTPNDLQPTMKIEYYRDTSINNNYLPREEITKYYTKTETNSQIQINSTSIQQSVAEIQTTLNSNNEAINSITNQVQTLQSSTSLQINAINTQLENGVEKLTNSLVRIDTNGINTSKTGETFNTQITNRTFEVRNSTDANVPALVFVGYDTNENRTVARIPELESRQATIGVHRTETIYEDNMYWTAEFYIGGGN